MIKRPWLIYTFITTLFWGIWGALIELPGKAGFPPTLVYIVWSLTMIPCALIGLAIIKWKLDIDLRSISYGMIIGLTGAGGQIVLFQALLNGPAYLVFPIISLSPVVTVMLSVFLLKETASKRHWAGIILALIAIALMSFQKPDNNAVGGYLWFIFAILVFFAWGTQAFYMKIANNHMKAESIFFYMMINGMMLIPAAYMMTDMTQNINWGFKGPYLAAIVSVLNSVGALTLVYAIRYGKVIIVAPLTNAVAPVITIILSLLIYMIIPNPVIITGIVFALTAVYLMAD
ncbi:MAG TPA: EamA family transporter [Bacteroidales bacterium]|nr:EamA family transporter [Bacteroidales bacterium]HCU18789.1 EamA family transporter [Bacteroidales bacterium]